MGSSRGRRSSGLSVRFGDSFGTSTAFLRMATPSLFRNSALLSGLVTREQLDQAVELVRLASVGPASATTTADDDDAVAAKLVELGYVTSYQAHQLRAGRTILNLGPYLITDWIGQGGMGQVFKAVHKMMGRECAVKILPSHKANPDTIASFSREIRTQAQLDHPHLVRAYDAGQDGKVHYLVTEYVPGTDLRRLVRTQGPLTMQQAANIVRQAALGLDYAHKRGLIHRDVKPGNILVTPDGVAKVSDLGLAGFVQEGDSDPRSGKIVGTADYLSPEQILTPREITHACDIYSLGCTLYYAVCGKVPYPGGAARDKARRHCEETPWHPRRFNPELSEEFVEVIADMMEKDPAKRIPTAADVVTRLDPWASQESTLPEQLMSKSRWAAPPIPTVKDEDVLAEIEPGGEWGEMDSRSVESASQLSQLSQGHDTASGARQDTKGPRSGNRRKPVAVAIVDSPSARDSMPAGLSVAIALAIAIPASMLFGAVLTFALLRLLG